MPRLIDFQEQWAKRADDFLILAFHDASVKTLRELDQKLPALESAFWKGRELPFPVLLDGSGQTLEAYGINSFPTSVVIDTEGRVVQGGSEGLLEEWLLSTSPEVKVMLEDLTEDFSKGLTLAIRRKDEEAAFALARYAETTSDLEELSKLARGLEKIGGPRAIVYFLGEQGLKGTSKDARLTAAKALRKLAEPGHYGVIKALEALMNDGEEDPAVRRAARDSRDALISH